jgi:hypothetical protein
VIVHPQDTGRNLLFVREFTVLWEEVAVLWKEVAVSMRGIYRLKGGN